MSPNPSSPVSDPITPYPLSGGERERSATTQSPRADDESASGFDEFAAMYPKKVELAEARRQWIAIAPGPQLRVEILAAVRRWTDTREWRQDDGRYVPKPAKWLRKRRWLDVPGFAVPAAPAAAPVPRVNPPALTAEQLQANARHAAQVREQLGLPPKVRACN